MTAPQDLSIRQLQYVVAVADTLGFHRAAERCHVSQPTLSAQVAQIESVLGVTLFERDRRRVLVTPRGEELVARARRVLLEVGDLIASAGRARDPFAGPLRIGVIPTVAPYLLPEVTPALTARYPKLRVVLREGRTADIMEQVHAGLLDAALLALEAELAEHAGVDVVRDVFVVAMPKGHPLARKRHVSLGDLEGESVLLLDDGHCFRTQALAICRKVAAREVDFRATSLATLVQMVSAGAGVTLLPRMAVDVENRRAQIEVRPFVAPSPGRTIALVWRTASPADAALRAIAGTVAKAVKLRVR
ncbi:MAG: LysR substrate-binding domain-containing protein [Deltaproteobacteria bacterium]